MTPSSSDDTNPFQARSSRREHAGWGAACTAAALLQAAVWACTERTETRAGTARPTVEASTAGQPATGTAPPSPSGNAVDGRSRRGQMLSHYADTATMRRALVAGKLAEYQAAAAAVARDEWAPSANHEQRELTQLVRAKAGDAEAAPSLIAAARALGALGEVCASCHVASGALQVPLAPEEPSAANPSMLGHAVASERLWAGLTLPSDASWASGMRLLLEDPGIAPSAEVSGAAQLLKELARKGARAEPGERGRVFADVLATCSGCHERLGVVLEDSVVVR